MAPNSNNIYTDLAFALPPTEMEYTRLGAAGLKATKIILGAMSYGSKDWANWVVEEEEPYVEERGVESLPNIPNGFVHHLPLPYVICL